MLVLTKASAHTLDLQTYLVHQVELSLGLPSHTDPMVQKEVGLESHQRCCKCRAVFMNNIHGHFEFHDGYLPAS